MITKARWINLQAKIYTVRYTYGFWVLCNWTLGFTKKKQKDKLPLLVIRENPNGEDNTPGIIIL